MLVDCKFSNVPKKAGIYCITNVKDGKRYIGSTGNLRKRLMGHLSNLNIGKHEVRQLQKDFNIHGENAISFHVLEIVGVDGESKNGVQHQLAFREAKYISMIQPEYNFNRRAKIYQGQ